LLSGPGNCWAQFVQRAYSAGGSGRIEQLPETMPVSGGPDVAGKVFAIFQPHGEPPDVTLKCDPERARQLREQYRSVVPGYHANKRLWNTISLDGDVPDDDLLDLVHHSYEQVVAGLPARTRAALGPF
jgi:predicted DNA-binding protein (MmcQ/YjbR family)